MSTIKLLSFAGTGAVALSPFTLLLPNEKKIVSPVFKKKISRLSPIKNAEANSDTLTELLEFPFSRKENSSTYLNNESLSVIQTENKESQTSNDSNHLKSHPEGIESIQLEANLSEWLDTINPLISGGAN